MATALAFSTESAGFPTGGRASTTAERTELALRIAAERGMSEARVRAVLRRWRPVQ